jgi:Zn-dependent protease
MEYLYLLMLYVIAALPILLAITLHEAAHAYAARHFGDPTAAQAGRISLNPLRHIDLFGTILLPLLCQLFAGVAFGYAKPVPVDFSRLRRPKRDMLWVAAAGPGANLVMALAWAMLYRLAIFFPFPLLKTMSGFGITINLILMFLNLLPLPPLDGGRIVISLLPLSLAQRFARIEPFGFLILILMLASGVLQDILGTCLRWAEHGIDLLFSLS